MEKFILFCSIVIFSSTVSTLILMKKWMKYYLLSCLSNLIKENGNEITNSELQKTVMAQADMINELKKEVNEKENQMASLIEHIHTFSIGLASDSRN